MTNPYKEFIDRLGYAKTYSNQMPYPSCNERRYIVSKGRPWPKNLSDGKYVYVVLPNNGEIRFSEHPRPKSIIHHPELCNGQDVLGAGLFTIISTLITELSNESGHYTPDEDSMYYVKLAFKFWEAPLSPNLNEDTRWGMFS